MKYKLRCLVCYYITTRKDLQKDRDGVRYTTELANLWYLIDFFHTILGNFKRGGTPALRVSRRAGVDSSWASPCEIEGL